MTFITSKGQLPNLLMTSPWKTQQTSLQAATLQGALVRWLLPKAFWEDRQFARILLRTIWNMTTGKYTKTATACRHANRNTAGS
eukprot:6476207-Amphidinium_carterae.1